MSQHLGFIWERVPQPLWTQTVAQRLIAALLVDEMQKQLEVNELERQMN